MLVFMSDINFLRFSFYLNLPSVVVLLNISVSSRVSFYLVTRMSKLSVFILSDK